MKAFVRSKDVRQHRAPINAIAFSEDGKYLVSGSESPPSTDGGIEADRIGSVGDDGNICITSSTGLMRKIKGQQESIVVICWAGRAQGSDKQFFITAGTDGSVKLWAMNGDRFKISRQVRVMDSAIEDLDVSGTSLAVVGEGGIFFYELHLNAKVKLRPVDPKLENVSGKRIQTDRGKIRSVRFFDEGKSVLVGLLNRVMGNIDLHQGSRRLAVWNLSSGVDIYTIDGDQLSPRVPISLKVKRNYTMQVRFIDEDTLAVGSDSGSVFLVSVQQKSVLARLRHSPRIRFKRMFLHHLSLASWRSPKVAEAPLIQAVAVHTATVEETGELQCLIAGGTSEPGRPGTLRVWTDNEPIFLRSTLKQDLLQEARNLASTGLTSTAVVLIGILAYRSYSARNLTPPPPPQSSVAASNSGIMARTLVAFLGTVVSVANVRGQHLAVRGLRAIAAAAMAF
ncbi:hypothetical protein NMY22_g10014 [Coprinellus aureogranulatus]|nr:hypothetical protein NMY22_g10014 [Coprinellus aureogranulatus]